MGWLLELLLDGIREICSQFIVDMMELVTEMFTELLSCNLSLFEELFSVVGALYKNVIVPMGIAILLLILVWQLFKSMFGKSVNGEEPIELIIRSAIALFFVVAAKPVVNYILKFAGTPYQWVVGTEIKVESFSGFVSALEGVTETLGVGKLSIALLMLIMQFVVAWNYFKMLFVIAERYVLLGVFSYTAPLAFSTGGSKSTNNILASWSKMFGGQVVLIILNAWCMKMFLSGYGNMMASSYGFTKFFVATLCLVGFCKITFKLDSYMASLGVNLGRPSAGMGAMGLIMAASRIFSQIGRGSAGTGGSAPSAGPDTSSASAGSSMTEGFAGPIPMMAEGTPGPSMDMPPENGFDENADTSAEGKKSGDFTYPSDNPPGSGSVLEELGVVSAEGSGGAGMDPGINMGSGVSIGETRETRTEGNASENQVGIGKNAASDMGGSEDGSEMDLQVAGIPEYDVPGTGERPEMGDGIGTGEAASSAGISVENGYGNDNVGILSEVGDYPVEEEDFGGTGESLMELDGNTIDSMGSPSGSDGVSYGNAGDAFGNAGIASRGSAHNGGGMASGAAGTMQEMNPIGSPEGILGEVGTDFHSGSIEPYGGSKTTGMGNMELTGAETAGNSDALADMELGENSGILSGMDFNGDTGAHSNMGFSDDTGAYSGMDFNGDTGTHSGMDFSGDAGARSDMDFGGDTGVHSGMEQSGDGGFSAGSMEPGDDGNMLFDMAPGQGDMLSGMESRENGHADSGIDQDESSRRLSGMNGVSGGTAVSETPYMRRASDSEGRAEKTAAGQTEAGSSLDEISAGDSGMANGMYEGLSMPKDTTVQKNPAGRKAGQENAQDTSAYPGEPMAEMDGHMSQLSAGQTIPSGNQKGHGRRKPAREFREVPKTREELRRMQQSRREQKPAEGSPFD